MVTGVVVRVILPVIIVVMRCVQNTNALFRVRPATMKPERRRLKMLKQEPIQRLTIFIEMAVMRELIQRKKQRSSQHSIRSTACAAVWHIGQHAEHLRCRLGMSESIVRPKWRIQGVAHRSRLGEGAEHCLHLPSCAQQMAMEQKLDSSWQLLRRMLEGHL